MRGVTATATDRPLRIAIAGFGWWGRHIANRLEGHHRIAIAAVIEPATQVHGEIRAQGLEPLNDLATALAREDVDAVILTTPNPVHEEQVIACAAAGSVRRKQRSSGGAVRRRQGPAAQRSAQEELDI